MDPIEHANDSNHHAITAHPSTSSLSSSPFPVTPTSQQNNPLRPVRPTSSRTRAPSIRIRRFPSAQSVENLITQSENARRNDDDGRRRSSSEPQRPQWLTAPVAVLERPATRQLHMPSVAEETSNLGLAAPQDGTGSVIQGLAPPPRNPGRFRRASVAAGSALGLYRDAATERRISVPVEPTYEYDSRIVDLLDVVDPEIATLSTLTNVQNSLFIPDLGRFLNRRPTYTLTRRPAGIPDVDVSGGDGGAEPQRPEARPTAPRTHTLDTITSTLSESRYAVLPHGASLEGWSLEDKQELNDHVRHMLHSRRSRFKRSLKGFGQYVKRPLGFLVTLYATLITLFGLAWVLFLIGWINVGGRQLYIINVIDNVLVALFAIMGDGLAPFRAVDTYHMIFIAHYHHLTWSLRKKKELPKLENKNDLPSKEEADVDVDVEDMAGSDEQQEFSVLTSKQQQRLTHHQNKFSKSHTFYKPHETTTHYAFPVRLLITIVVLLDCHSLFQIALGTCTWAINYHVRPFALTTVILCCSITCNVTGGVLISIGDHKTRKKDVVERMLRQELTEEAMTKLEKKKEKERTKTDDDLEEAPDPS
ncbi:MAG: hypothetical protein M1834_000724 [Cirrosporium novae-zelandiae]|nr:MAG: hypothetical protein M1834_000724 [Cirrosporium novae-zelandiae]